MRTEMTTKVGSLVLAAPVLTAAGTSGHGAELAAYGPLTRLGGVVVKSLAAFEWPGNPAPRVAALRDGSMINSVGLAGPGVQRWTTHYLPALIDSGATPIASIWGRRVEEFGQAASALGGVTGIVALEVNVSCPNLEDRTKLFSNSPEATAAAVEASKAAGIPIWAKLGPMTPDLLAVAGAALDAGAEALVLTNTLLGLALDGQTGRPRLGGGGGGVSGPALHEVALRAVAECRTAFPDAGIVGVGGVANGLHAKEFLLAGADACEVGTATFADPRAPWRVLDDLTRICARQGVANVRELVGSGLR